MSSVIKVITCTIPKGFDIKKIIELKKQLVTHILPKKNRKVIMTIAFKSNKRATKNIKAMKKMIPDLVALGD